MTVLKGGVNGAIGLLDGPGNIRRKMFSEFFNPRLTHSRNPYLRNSPHAVDQIGMLPGKNTSRSLAKMRRA
ncbi:hypothetical protein [Bradyrhizobium sp.]|uniref:hypothetical protein n=1 Tax=Bradyrhizobium sp. TaxID=376 RepID=UPI003C71141F